MNPSEKNNFEQDWKRILDDASVPPPSSVWEGIEARLDADDDHKVIPLPWWQNRKLWLFAASISALLLVASGVWLNHSQNTNLTSAWKTATEKVLQSQELSGVTDENGSLATIEREHTHQDSDAPPQDFSVTEKIEIAKEKRIATVKIKVGDTGNGNTRFGNSTEKNAVSPVNLKQWETIQGIILDTYQEAQRNIANAESKKESVQESMEMLAIKKPSEQEIFLQNRYVYFNPNLELEIKEDIINKKEYWAGVSFMPATFNPNIQVVSAPPSYQSMAYSRQKAVTGNSKAGVSYSFQTQGGIKVSKHWSVEVGINYLQGNSIYEGGGYLLNSKATNQSSNVLESAIAERGKVAQEMVPSSPSLGNGVLGTSTLYINVNKDIANNYRYLQVPLQAGFILNPDGKWNYSLLGGIVSNIFLRNDLGSSNGEVITTKPNDNVYRTMNLATSTGLRIQYKLSEKWRANLTGSYQQAVTSGVHSDISLKSKPNMYGVAWGVRYSF